MAPAYSFIPTESSYPASAGTVPAMLGTPGADTLAGTPASDVVFGRDGNDVLRGHGGNDTLCGNEGDDVIDGGADLDIAIYAGPRSSYGILVQAHGVSVLDRAGQEGVDYLVNVERLAFDDRSVALDLGANAGRAAMLLGAIFGLEALYNRESMGRALSVYDAGRMDAEIMERAIQMRWNYATPTNEQFVNTVYQNVYGHAPSSAEFEHYMARLETGRDTLSSLGMLAQYSDANVAHIDLVGLAQTGVEYSPFVVQIQLVTE
ncbi:MAG: DUF4214 domain-containing protein [Burkholderiaceae bacterium]|nr:DUF4214 domain-containing protein [Burkholderiaceae bacterium]